MSLARVVHNEPQVRYDYRVAGVGEYLASLVMNSSEAVRHELADKLLAVLFHTPDAQLLIRVPTPIPEILGDVDG